jgi:hypothetical protein
LTPIGTLVPCSHPSVIKIRFDTMACSWMLCVEIKTRAVSGIWLRETLALRSGFRKERRQLLAGCTRSPTNGEHRFTLTYPQDRAISGASANRISAINELAHERSAQRNVALMYALALNSRADAFTLM